MKTTRLFLSVLLAVTGLLACGDDETTPVNNTSTNNTNTNNNTNNTNNIEPDMDTDTDVDMDPEGLFIPGLSGPVEVRTDTNGMTHISCEQDLDCIAAQGYAHASDRFAQMDLRRRLARGKVSEMAGSIALSVDRGYRNRLMTRDGKYLEVAFYEGLKPETKAIVDAYTSGVNAWLDDLRNGRNGAKLSDEYNFPVLKTDVIPDWEGADSAACALLLMDDLSNSSGKDLEQGEYTDLVEANTLFQVLGQLSATGSSTFMWGTYPPQMLRFPDLGAFETAVSRVKKDADLIRRTRESLMPSDMFRQEDGFGSNNWVLGPSVTSTGKAILANDPHLSLTNPALWYLVSLDSKTSGSGDLHVAGVSFAGIPSILLGHNEHIAWGATVVFYDMADIYIEELDETGKKVVFNGEMVDIIEVEHTYQVANGNPVVETLRIVPHHGPIIEYDARNNRAVSLRWSGHDADTDFDAFFGLAKAKSLDEAEQALLNATSTNQNFVVIDTNDNIGWFPFSRVPVRPWASLENPPWMPLSGSGEFEWDGYMDYADLPQVKNPSTGYVITANQDATGALFDGDPTNDGYNMLQSFPAPGYRHQRIVDLVVERTLTPQDVVDIQGDHYMFHGEQITSQVLSYLTQVDGMLNVDTQRVVDALSAWKGSCPTGLTTSKTNSAGVADAEETADSIGCAVFHTLLFHLTDEIFGDEIGAMIPTSRAYSATYILMTDPMRISESYWDDTTTEEIYEGPLDIILRAVNATGETMKQRFTTDTDKWRWGRMHNVLFAADLLGSLVSTFNNGPFAAPGGQWTVNVANPRNVGGEDYSFRAGASMRLMVENTADGLKGKISFPGGQKHFRDSPYYDNLVEGWLNNTPIDLPFKAADIAGITDSTITIEPAPN